MPLMYYRSQPKHEVSIWKISESETFFIEALREEGFPPDGGMRINHPQKRIQWLASRYLLCMTHPAAIVNQSSRKPTLSNGPELSFSHSEDHAAVLMSKDHSGIDIQVFSEKLKRIAPKFANPGETDMIEAREEVGALTLLWAIKEAIFKYYTTQLPFKNIQLLDHDPVSNTAIVEVNRRGSKKIHRLHADFLEGMGLAYVLE